MKLFGVFLLISVMVFVRGLEEGAPSKSCYNFTIEHPGFDTPFIAYSECDPPFCSQGVEVLALVDDNGTEIKSTPSTYLCGALYRVRVYNSPQLQGFLVQARDNTDSFAEDATIWGTWESNDTNTWHALSCQRSQNSDDTTLYLNSATQSAILSGGEQFLYWRAPNQTEAPPPEIAFWFTIVRERITFYRSAKGPTLMRDESCYVPMPTSTAALMPSPSLQTRGPTITSTPEKKSIPVAAIAGASAGGGVVVVAVGVLAVIVIVTVCVLKKDKGKSTTDRYTMSKLNKEVKITAYEEVESTAKEDVESTAKEGVENTAYEGVESTAKESIADRHT